MADDIAIVIKVEDSGVLRAVKNTKTLQSNVKTLSDTFKGGSLSQRQYYKGISELATATGKGEAELRKYAAEVRKVQKAEAEAKAATKANTDEIKRYRQARREATEENRRYDTEARKALQTSKQQAIAAKQAAQEEERLKNKFVEGYTAMNVYSRELNDLAIARKKGIITTQQQEEAVERLNLALASGTGAFSQFGAAAGVGGRRMSSTGMAMQQTGYQVGDFLVQVQGGTNAMVAFGQQATQLVGILPMFNSFLGISGTSLIALSAGLGIGIPLVTAIGAAFMRTREQGKTLRETVDNLESSLAALSTLTETYTLEGLVSLKEKYGEVNAEILNLIESQRFLAQTELNKSIKDTIDSLSELAGGRWFDIGISEKASALLALRSQFEMTKNDAEVLYQAFQDVSSAESGSLAQADALAKVSSMLKTVLSNTEDVSTAQLEALEAVVDTEAAIREMNEAAPNASWMNAAITGVNSLYNRIVEAIGKVRDLKGETNLGNTRPKGRSIDALAEFEDRRAEGQTRPQGRPLDFGTSSSSGSSRKSSGGGGKSSVDEAAEAIKKLREQLTLQEALLGKTEAQRQVIQALGVDYEKIYGAKATDAIIARIEALKAEEEQIANIQSVADTMKSSMSDAFMSMVEGTKSFKDAMKDMARAVIKQLFDILVVQQLVGSFDAQTKQGTGLAGALMGGLSGLFGGATKQANGGAWTKGVQMYANGGVVGSPTMFSHSGGLGVMGEAGPEAIMPLKRGANGKLGVQAEGGGGSVVVNQSFNFSANGDESVKKIIAQAAPQIAKMTQQGLMDQRRRGGVVKSTFS